MIVRMQCNVVQRHHHSRHRIIRGGDQADHHSRHHHHSRHRDIMGGDLADGCPGGGRELDREMRDRTGGRGQEGRGGGGAGGRGRGQEGRGAE